MHRTSKLLLAAAAAGAVVAAGGACVAASATGAARPAAATFTAACATAPAGQVRCLAEYRSAGTRPAAAGTAPAGYGPADLRSAYHLPDTGGTGTIAIVDAFGYPTAEADLAAYRSQYGLPACTVASGCLTILNQRGDTAPLPTPQPGWAVETALDLDMASAACPACPLLLVQADDPAFADMGAAVDTAVAHGAAVVSNSYGASEFTGMDGYAAHYSHPGVPMLVASGDHGFSRANFPANLDSVIAVGGTSLTRAANARGWTEQAWSGSGSGCSAWIDKPAWQHDPNCDMRTTADISAVADPHTGVAVYDTFELTEPGWLVVGGTSAASPFVAGVIALSGHAGAVTAERLYAEPSAFFDVVGGSNGYCGGDYLCTGLPGYDAPTGLGSPNGLTPFA